MQEEVRSSEFPYWQEASKLCPGRAVMLALFALMWLPHSLSAAPARGAPDSNHFGVGVDSKVTSQAKEPTGSLETDPGGVTRLLSPATTLPHDGKSGHKTFESGLSAANITEEDIEYSPEEQTIQVGQKVRVENRDPFEHKSRVTRKLDDGSFGRIVVKDHVEKPETSFLFSFSETGTYEIRCMLHDGMVATLHVVR